MNDHGGLRAPGGDARLHEERLGPLHRLATAALGRYDLPAGAEARLVNVSENATFRVDAPGADAKWALRVHRDGYHRRNAIASELAWLISLREDSAVVTPTPIEGTDGELIQLVTDNALPNPRHVVLFAWEDGVDPDEREQDLRGPFEVLGEITARMHLHVRRWRKPAGFERFTWDYETTLGRRPHWGPWRDGMGITPEIEALFARTIDLVRRRLEGFGASPDRFNLIHGDLRLANLLIDGGTTKVIDFDDCGFGWLMYDCATTVSFFEHRARGAGARRGVAPRLPQGDRPPPGRRGGDPDLRDPPAPPPRRVDRVAFGDGPRPIDGGRVHRRLGAALRGIPLPLRVRLHVENNPASPRSSPAGKRGDVRPMLRRSARTILRSARNASRVLARTAEDAGATAASRRRPARRCCRGG